MPRALLSVPRQRRTPITEQTKVDLGPYVDRYNVQQLFPSTVSDALNLLMVCWPLFFGLLLECRRVLQDLRPFDLAILQEQLRIEVDATVDMDFGCLPMLKAYLVLV